MLVTPFALVMAQIGRDRCGPLMTVVVPWDILQASSKVLAMTTCAHGGAQLPIRVQREGWPVEDAGNRPAD
jgi:hypothetical protein